MVHLELLYKNAAARPSGPCNRLVVVSNRVAAPSDSCQPSAGGLAVALQAALEIRGGIWFGWSGKISSEADPAPRVTSHGAINYALTDLCRRDFEEYYNGFANRALWPICHYRLDLADLSERNATGYFRVNAQFARRLGTMLRRDDIIWVHDYHMIPIANCLRQMGCTNRIGFFLHIPWPAQGVAAALPGFERILQAFAAYDLIGFQTASDATNFRDCLVEAKVGEIKGDGWCEAFGRRFQFGAFPISIDTEGFGREARIAEKNVTVKRMRASLEGRPLIIGVDRLDYSKGIKQRIEAFSAFVERTPRAAQARVTMLQITPKSRSDVPEYAKMQREVAEQVGRVNGQWGDIDWTPVRYTHKVMSQPTLAGLYRIARVGLVTPLRDGMNLVAKEYVAAQSPEDPGVLVLSQFAGAAAELKSALIVNPFDIEATADAIARALDMPLSERRERWAANMEVLRANTVETWMSHFLEALGDDSDASPPFGDVALDEPPATLEHAAPVPAALEPKHQEATDRWRKTSPVWMTYRH